MEFYLILVAKLMMLIECRRFNQPTEFERCNYGAMVTDKFLQVPSVGYSGVE